MGSHYCDINSAAQVSLLPHKVLREISDLTVFKAISSDLKVPTSKIPGISDCFEGTMTPELPLVTYGLLLNLRNINVLVNIKESTTSHTLLLIDVVNV